MQTVAVAPNPAPCMQNLQIYKYLQISEARDYWAGVTPIVIGPCLKPPWQNVLIILELQGVLSQTTLLSPVHTDIVPGVPFSTFLKSLNKCS